MSQPLFIMHNKHAPDCGVPPTFSNEEQEHYFGYFENAHGEQWIFVYDRGRRKGELRGGDAGWADPFPVEGGRLTDLVLGKEEQEWLRACWQAATPGAR